MAKRRIGTVAAIWRYPVKSMLGEKLAESTVTSGGLAGDRAWALREVKSGRVLTAKKYPKLLEMRSAYEGAPEAGGRLAPVRIELPGGRKIHAADPDASSVLSSLLASEVRIERAEPEQDNVAGIDPATVFGEVGVENVFPGMSAATLPDSFPLPKGTFFDSATIHVLAGGTLDHMRRLAGGNSIFDPRRFRPNVYVETIAADGFVEDEWLGGVLEVGGSVRITGMKPALRCVMTTHPQYDLPRDSVILRTSAQHHHANVGVFAGVGAPGTIRVGDPVFLEK
jgi:MOSC domain-containing protein